MSERQGTPQLREARRYILTVEKVPREARDEFRRLSSQETYFEIRRGSVGDRVAYSVEMTDEEAERARRAEVDPSSNLIALEPNQRARPTAVPGAAVVNFLAMQNAYGNPDYNGRGVDVGVIDTGLSSAVASYFGSRLKASKGYDSSGTPDNGIHPENEHGSKMSSLAVPPSSRLVFGGTANLSWDEIIVMLYWMVDEIGVRIVNMSLIATSTSTAMDDATSHARAQNVAVFASRGNDNNAAAGYPADSPGVKAISAYDTRTGRKSSYSSYGNVWAASVGDVANWLTPSGVERATIDENGGGTSAASAIASHVAARFMTGGQSAGSTIRYLQRHARRTGVSPVYEGHGILQLDAARNTLDREKPPKENLDGTPAPPGGGMPPRYMPGGSEDLWSSAGKSPPAGDGCMP